MDETELRRGLTVTVGGRPRAELRELLSRHGVRTNEQAEALLDGPAFDETPARAVTVVERTVRELGSAHGATFPELLAGAARHGLAVCPPDTAPYLRLTLVDQAEAPDAVLRHGRAPTASLSVIAEPLSSDGSAPRGFYLRVVEGVVWLRGYSCDDAHVWSADDRLVFRILEP